MEYSRTPQPIDPAPVPSVSAGQATDPMLSLAGLDQALRSVLQRKYPAPKAHGARSRWTEREVATAINLVHNAAAMMRSTEDNARMLALRAAEDLEAAEARIRSAEARAKEHEEWLVQIHGVLLGTFPGRRAEKLLDAVSRA